MAENTTYNNGQKPQAKKPGKNAAEEASLSSFVFGKVQPQAIPLEEAVLGALMLDREALLMVADVLKPESFYKEAHRCIYEAILRLFNKMEPVDLLTVTEEIKLAGELDKIGGGYYLVELSNRVASAANIEAHARIIVQKFIGRELAGIGTTLVRDAYEETTDVFELLEDTETALFRLRGGHGSKEKSMAELSRLVFANMEKAMACEGVTGIISGLKHLDMVTGGWQNSDFIVLAARPSMGKTSLMISFALKAALDGKPVQIFSLEMPAIQLHARLISILSDVPLMGILRGFVYEVQNGVSEKRNLYPYEWQRIQEAVQVLDRLPIHIDDTPGISVMELRARSRRAKQKHGVELVLVDYLQLMTGGGEEKRNGNREQEVSLISRTMKGVAKSLDVPVIALSQLSRDVEKRGGSKRPGLSDLRDSGSIEQDCDVCIFVYRPEYYQILEDESGNSLKGIAELIIAKHRNGSLETIRAKFDGTCTKFSDLSMFDQDQNFPANEPAKPWSPTKHLPPEDNTGNPLQGNVISRQSRMNDEDIPF